MSVPIDHQFSRLKLHQWVIVYFPSEIALPAPPTNFLSLPLGALQVAHQVPQYVSFLLPNPSTPPISACMSRPMPHIQTHSVQKLVN